MGSTFIFFFNAWNKKVQSLHAPLVLRLVSIFFQKYWIYGIPGTEQGTPWEGYQFQTGRTSTQTQTHSQSLSVRWSTNQVTCKGNRPKSPPKKNTASQQTWNRELLARWKRWKQPCSNVKTGWNYHQSLRKGWSNVNLRTPSGNRYGLMPSLWRRADASLWACINLSVWGGDD